MILDKTYNLESLDDLGKVNNDVVDSICNHVYLDDKLLYNVKLVISELVINGFVHGNKNRCALEMNIQMQDKNSMVITVDDGGTGFDADNKKDVAEVDSESGRGLILVRAFTDDIEYNDVGNKVQVTIAL